MWAAVRGQRVAGWAAVSNMGSAAPRCSQRQRGSGGVRAYLVRQAVAARVSRHAAMRPPSGPRAHLQVDRRRLCGHHPLEDELRLLPPRDAVDALAPLRSRHGRIDIEFERV